MKKAKLFENGRSQAVRLPKEFRFAGDAVGIRRVGKAVVLVPIDEPWDTLFDALGQFSTDYMADGRPRQERQELEDIFP
ncbi:MAG: antitoxin [Planctomycetes bacterium]|nr:antitoxin [Planctomycetota bacterium]